MPSFLSGLSLIRRESLLLFLSGVPAQAGIHGLLTTSEEPGGQHLGAGALDSEMKGFLVRPEDFTPQGALLHQSPR